VLTKSIKVADSLIRFNLRQYLT